MNLLAIMLHSWASNGSRSARITASVPRPSMGTVIAAKNGIFSRSAIVRSATKEHQHAESNAIRVKRKQTWRPKQKYRHRRHIKNRRIRQRQMQGANRQAGRLPQRTRSPIPDHGAACHRLLTVFSVISPDNQFPSGRNSTRTVPSNMCRSRRRLQFSMYVRSRCMFSSNDGESRAVICHSPVMPGFMSSRR